MRELSIQFSQEAFKWHVYQKCPMKLSKLYYEIQMPHSLLNTDDTAIDLSIITVTYQSENHIENCISSVIASTITDRYEHIIVDNGSVDGTVAIVEEYSRYVQFIKNKENLGFAGANNQAIKRAKGRYILYLNPDMQIISGYLDDLITLMDQNAQIGAASCKLVDANRKSLNSLRPSKIPSLRAFVLHFFLRLPVGSYWKSNVLYPQFQDDQEQSVELVRGAFLMTKKEIVQKLGYAFDPRFFILFEDIDLCKNISQMGYKIQYFPKIHCIDFFSQSFIQRHWMWYYKNLSISFVRFASKWYSNIHLLWIIPSLLAGFFVRIIYWIRGLRTQKILSYYQSNTLMQYIIKNYGQYTQRD